MEETVHALDYVHVLRRRKVWLITPIVLSILVGVALVQVLPKEYEASTTIAVPAPVVSPSYINSSGPLDNQERLRALNQQLVSTSILSSVATDAGLLKDAPVEGTAEERLGRVVGALRQAISVRLPNEVINANEPRRLDAFLIIYKDGDPTRAKLVADLLATRFVAENSKARALRAEGTSAFIAEQLEATQQRLVDYEGQLRVAKEAHMGELPEQTQANLATLAGLRQQLESNANALRGEEDRLSMTERTIESLTRVQDDADGRLRSGDPESPEGRLAQLERDLAAARARYQSKHPDVQRLEEEVEIARQRVASAPKRPAEVRPPPYLNDPFYKQAVGERVSRQQRIRDLQRNEKDLQREILMYQGRVESAPRVEQQLAAMVRDYDLERQHYADLTSKLHSATISESVERTGVSEQFTLLYPAAFPTVPTKPVPLRVMLLSLASGLAVGVGLTLLREYLDRSVRDVRALRNEFDVPVLGEIARIHPR